MATKSHKKELWIYAILITVASIVSGIWLGMWGSGAGDINVVLRVIIILALFCICLFATMRLGLFLQFSAKQWVIAIVLLIFVWPASLIYMASRRPPVVQQQFQQ